MFSRSPTKIILLVFFALLITLLPVQAQAQEPVVYGVFFYSPNCSHCHEVIDNHWPAIQAEFGDQLQILFIDVTTAEGGQLMGNAIESMHIPSNGVPMLIIGSDVLIGSKNIPELAPGIIRDGLNAGGIGYPPIPDVRGIFEQDTANTFTTASSTSPSGTFREPANLVALVVLVGLIGNLAMVTVALWDSLRGRRQLLRWIETSPSWWFMLAGIVLGLGLSFSLVAGSFDDGQALLISTVVLILFGMLAVTLYDKTPLRQLANYAIPLIIVAGLLVAGYLAYIETTQVEATCGTMGDCNSVQQSSYAYIVGIPIGIIGVAGYVAILFTWGLARYGNWQKADWLLFGMVLIGVGFSIYLTFLEPFVIKASCVWCLTSAVLMTMLLWLTLPTRKLSVSRSR